MLPWVAPTFGVTSVTLCEISDIVQESARYISFGWALRRYIVVIVRVSMSDMPRSS